MTTVVLTEEEARLFIEFQKRYAFIKLLESLGVFSLKNASLKVNFDPAGTIGTVEVNQFYRP